MYEMTSDLLRGNAMATQVSQKVQDVRPARFLSEDEARNMKENLAQTNFGMSLDEFTRAWMAGEFDQDQENHHKVVSLAMMLPEYWED